MYKCGSTTLRNILHTKKKQDKPLYQPFTVIRNPIERVPSIYAEMVRMNNHKGLEFTEWLKELRKGFYDYHQIPMTYWLKDIPKDMKVFLRVGDALQWLGIESNKVLNPRRIAVNITPEDIELIEELYKEDIEYYDGQYYYLNI